MGKKYIHLRCRSCGKRMRAPAHAAGKRSKCTQCGRPLLVPSLPDRLTLSKGSASRQKSDSRNVVPRNRRYSVIAPERVQITIRVDDSTESVFVRLLDISKGGVKIAAPSSLAGWPLLTVTIKSDLLPASLVLQTQIQWVRPTEDGGWTVGGSFMPPISDEQFHLLLNSDLLERRAFRRERVQAKAQVRWELDDSRVVAGLRDLSQEGFCLVMRQGGAIGSRVLVTVERDDVATPVVGQTQWKEGSDKGVLVGCSFVDDRGYHEWQRLLDSQSVPSSSQGRQLRCRWWLWLFVLTAFLIAAAGIGWLFLGGQFNPMRFQW